MPYRQTFFVNNNYYHLFNRGVAKKVVFDGASDYQRFLDTLFYYQFSNPKPKFSTYNRFKTMRFQNNPKIVDIVCYCLMPNHFHLLIRQVMKGGASEFMRKVLNSYTKYYNTKYHRVGPLFQGEFKDAPIETEEQLLHVSRYIHLNPYVTGLTDDLREFAYSSYLEFIGQRAETRCTPQPVLAFFNDKKEYEQFVLDQRDYAKNLEQIKHVLIESTIPHPVWNS